MIHTMKLALKKLIYPPTSKINSMFNIQINKMTWVKYDLASISPTFL